MEIFYATGIMVAELCGLDTVDIDDERRTVRVLGKRSKERVVPIGIPAAEAVRQWRDAGRPLLASERSGPALYLGARGGRPGPRTARPGGPGRGAAPRAPPPAGPAGPRPTPATQLPHGGA